MDLSFHAARIACNVASHLSHWCQRRWRNAEARILFIIGTGRSGTHFLTRCLIGNEKLVDFMDGHENPRVFQLIRDAAVDPALAPSHLAMARLWYARYAARAQPRWFVDQSHPNIWFAEHWASVFPSAKFVGIIRNPYSVVASMLKHEGVRRWVEEWKRYPIPNKFLGISDRNIHAYGQMTIVERCTVRWISHYTRLQSLKECISSRLYVVEYEQLCQSPEETLARIARWMGFDGHFLIPEVQVSALSKYNTLTDQHISEIENMLQKAGIDKRHRVFPTITPMLENPRFNLRYSEQNLAYKS